MRQGTLELAFLGLQILWISMTWANIQNEKPLSNKSEKLEEMRKSLEQLLKK